jgi:hypothetical protein
MQCSYNVTSRGVRVTIVAVEKHQVLNIMSLYLYSYLSYPACKSHVFCAVYYSHLLFPYFSTLSHKRRDFIKKKCKNLCFNLLFNFVGNISHSKHNSARFTINLYRASFDVPVILGRFYWNWNFLSIFSKNPYIKCNEYTPSGSRAVPCGRTDRHDEDTSRFSQFCERA